jgi:hypothetical protein
MLGDLHAPTFRDRLKRSGRSIVARKAIGCRARQRSARLHVQPVRGRP